MDTFEIITISLTYGITLLSFIHTMVTNYFYSQLRLDFRRVFAVTVFLIFLSSTFNFVIFFVSEGKYVHIVDFLFVLSISSVIFLLEVAFKEKFRKELVGLCVSFFLLVVLLITGLYGEVVIDGIKYSSIVYFLSLGIILSVGSRIVVGIVKKNPNYLSSDVYFGFRQMLFGMSILMIVLLLAAFGVFVNKCLLYGILFTVLILTVMYSRMNYTFFLKNRLVEENEKFMSLYKTMVDDILVGKEIIDKLLPNRKNVNSLYFDKYFKPAVLVGGDFLDVIPLSDTKFIAYVADVSGHGISAGIIVSMIKALLLKEVVEGYSDLPSLVKRLNSDFNTLVKDTGRYATLFIGLIDKLKKKFWYVSCGHTECIYWSSRLNEFFLLSSTAPILGLFNKIDAVSSEIDFDTNDYLLLISDGVFSVIDKNGRNLNYDDFIGILSRYISPEIMPNELIFRVSQDLEDIMEGGQVMDDITMFFIKL